MTYKQNRYELRPGETVLAALLRHRVEMGFSCRQGSCQACVMQRLDGDVPADAQGGLDSAVAARQYFLACQYRPDEDIAVSAPDGENALLRCRLVESDFPSPTIRRLFLAPAFEIDYRAGQHLQLLRNDMLSRPYSIASVRGLDPYIELHVRIVRDGAFSNWVHDQLDQDELLAITGPAGDCYYLPGRPDQPLLLIGTGTGVSPLIGIARDALRQEHSGPIHLYHGNTHAVDLYLDETLRGLAAAHEQFHYHPCVSGEAVGAEARQGRATDIAFADFADLSGFRVFLCGLPAMVAGASQNAARMGAAPYDIVGEAFDFAHVRQSLA